MILKKKSPRGSVLLTTLAFIVAITMVVWSVYDLSLTTYRLTLRNEYLGRAKAVADSELEYMYYQAVNQMMSGASGINVTQALSTAGICDIPHPNVEGGSVTPTTSFSPFCYLQRSDPANWIVKRSISYDTGATGTIPNTTGSAMVETGTYNYFTIEVEITSNTSAVGSGIDVREGRRINSSSASIFQYNVFSQGDLEFSPGGNTTINGAIAANGSIYMGASKSGVTGSELLVNAQVMYLAGSTFDTTTLANGTAINAPTFGTSQAQQVSTMTQAQNLVGGLDATTTAKTYGAGSSATGLFGMITADPITDPADYNNQLLTATNNVYRAAIVPPPSAVASEVQNYPTTYTAADYPGVSSFNGLADDPTVSDNRAYNSAGLIITVNPDGSATFATQTSGGGTPTVVGSTSAPGSNPYNGVIVGNAAGSMYDERQGSTVGVTQIDISKLKTALGSNYTSFNGLLYVYVANGTAAHPAAVQLVNGASTPGNTGSPPTGFSVATNGGLYVQGDYNTIASDGSTSIVNSDGSVMSDSQISNAGVTVNPAMLMADAVTVLSSTWSNPTTATDISTRTATSGSTTIAAGIVTGNVTNNTTTSNGSTYLVDGSGSYVYSGGGQNLVQFDENWSNSTVNFYGSIGRLFQSTNFTAPFVQPNVLNAAGQYVYWTPGSRSYTFNDALAKSKPPGSPVTTNYSRGTFFTW